MQVVSRMGMTVICLFSRVEWLYDIFNYVKK